MDMHIIIGMLTLVYLSVKHTESVQCAYFALDILLSAEMCAVYMAYAVVQCVQWPSDCAAMSLFYAPVQSTSGVIERLALERGARVCAVCLADAKRSMHD